MSGSSSVLYSPEECVEGVFSELRPKGVLGSSHRTFAFVTFVVTLGRRWSCRVVVL
jgi:hypothetical protein